MSTPDELTVRFDLAGETDDPVALERARVAAAVRLLDEPPRELVLADRYELGSRLGAGGNGVVYAARDRQLDRQVAIKLLHPHAGMDENARARLEREAKVLAQLSHPNIVTVFDLGTSGPQLFIAMELVAGVSLSAWLRERERSVREIRGNAVQITAGGVHTCALMDTGTVRCWGFGQYGRLGYGNTASIGDDESPASAGDVDVGGVVVEIDAGGSHTCAVMDTAAVRCWGFGNSGQLGYGGFVYPEGFGVGDDETPASVGDVNTGGAAVLHAVAAAVHTCIVVDPCNPPNGVAPESQWLEVAPRCWGANESHQAGPFGSFWEASKQHCVPLDEFAADVDAGATHSCARLSSGGAQCWGGGTYGQLGYGNTDTVVSASSETAPIDVGASVTKIATGDYHTCALTDTGAVRCWGLGANGRLGYGSNDNVGDDEAPASMGDVPVL